VPVAITSPGNQIIMRESSGSEINRIDHQGGAAGLLYHSVQASFHERVARIGCV